MDYFQKDFFKGYFGDKHSYLLTKGQTDNLTRADVSVVIKYTKEFAATLGVFPVTGMYLLAARTIHVNQSSKIFIKSPSSFLESLKELYDFRNNNPQLKKNIVY